MDELTLVQSKNTVDLSNSESSLSEKIVQEVNIIIAELFSKENSSEYLTKENARQIILDNLKYYKEEAAEQFLKRLEKSFRDDEKKGAFMVFLSIYNNDQIIAFDMLEVIPDDWKYFKKVSFSARDNRGKISRLAESIFLPGRIFDEVELSSNDNEYSVYSAIDFSKVFIKKIKLRGEILDLWDNYSMVEDDIFIDNEIVYQQPTHLDFGSCDELENKFRYVLEMNQEINQQLIYSKGIVVFIGGEPIGLLKFYGEPTMIASRTIVNKDGNILFYRGMAYALAEKKKDFVGHEKKFLAEAMEIVLGYPDNYKHLNSVSLNDLAEQKIGLVKNNLRFVRDFEIVKKIASMASNKSMLAQIKMFDAKQIKISLSDVKEQNFTV